MKAFITTEIKNPIAPITTIPNAETFATCSNSFLLGFFITVQTRLHFNKKDFAPDTMFTIYKLKTEGF